MLKQTRIDLGGWLIGPIFISVAKNDRVWFTHMYTPRITLLRQGAIAAISRDLVDAIPSSPIVGSPLAELRHSRCGCC